jgi:hypothetical protein
LKYYLNLKKVSFNDKPGWTLEMMAEQVEDMFTAISERRIAQKVIETLKSQAVSDIFELSDYMSSYKKTSAKMSEQNGSATS